MISNNRLFHTLAVARLMKEKCQQLGKSEQYSNQMFSLGMLHDIGYEFDENNHNFIGAEVISNTNYKYWQEIKYHGIPNPPYSSFELNLLNWADMHVDSKGNVVTFEERLKDISNRYGIESEVYQRAFKLVEIIKEEIK